ncbi:hypothetical protein [Dankookia rubra]|nr:hypothetical protein [Dankookia rubra]
MVLILVVSAFGGIDGVQVRLIADPLCVPGCVALAMAGNFVSMRWRCGG